MKRTRDHPLALSTVNTHLESEHTPTSTHPSTGYLHTFGLWHDLLEEMQQSVVSFLDNGTKEALSHTYKDAWNKWHVSLGDGDNKALKRIANHLAENAPLRYIRAFVCNACDRIEDTDRYRKTIRYLTRWGRWGNTDVTEFILDCYQAQFWDEMNEPHFLALLAAIKYSNHKIFESLFAYQFMRYVCESNESELLLGRLGLVVHYCGRYGNVQAFNKVAARVAICGLRTGCRCRLATRYAEVIIANLSSKPLYAFNWSDLMATEEFRYIFADSQLTASIFSRALGFDVRSDRLHFERIENCYVLWKVLGPDHKAAIRSVWNEINESIHIVSTIGQLFDTKSFWMKTIWSKERMMPILGMAKEMGLSPTGFNLESDPISAMVFLVAEATVCGATEALCQWLFDHNAYDFHFLREHDTGPYLSAYERFKDAFQSLKELSQDNDIILIGLDLVDLVQRWFATHEFPNCVEVRSIVDEVCRELLVGQKSSCDSKETEVA